MFEFNLDDVLEVLLVVLEVLLVVLSFNMNNFDNRFPAVLVKFTMSNKKWTKNCLNFDFISLFFSPFPPPPPTDYASVHKKCNNFEYVCYNVYNLVIRQTHSNKLKTSSNYSFLVEIRAKGWFKIAKNSRMHQEPLRMFQLLS